MKFLKNLATAFFLLTLASRIDEKPVPGFRHHR